MTQKLKYLSVLLLVVWLYPALLQAYIQQIVFPKMLKPKVQYNPPKNSAGQIDYTKYVIGQDLHYPPRPMQWPGGTTGVVPIQFGINGCTDAPINPGDAYDAANKKYSDTNPIGKIHLKQSVIWGTDQWNKAGYRQSIKDTTVGTQSSAAFFPSQTQLFKSACTVEFQNETNDGNTPNNINNLLFSSEAMSNSQDMKNDLSLANVVALTTSFAADTPGGNSAVGSIIESDIQFNDTRYIFVYDCQTGESPATSLCGRTERSCNIKTATGTSTTSSTSTSTSSSTGTSTSKSLIRGRLALDADQTPRDCIHLKDVITHELGHVLGLDHSPDMNSTMFYQTADGQRTLEPDDVSGIYATYEYTGRFKKATNRITGTISIGGRGTTPEELAKVKGVFGGYVQAINLTEGRIGSGVLTFDSSGNYEMNGLREGFYALMLRNYPKYGSDMSFSFFRGFLGGSRYGLGVPGTPVDGNNWCANPFCTVMEGTVFPSFNLADGIWKHAKFLKVFSLKNPDKNWTSGEQINNVNFNELQFLDTSDPFELAEKTPNSPDGEFFLQCPGDDDPANKSFTYLNRAWVGMYGGTGGKTTSGDVDSYTFKLTKGGKVEFRILAPELGSAVDPAARLVLGTKDCSYATDSTCADLTISVEQQVKLADGHASKDSDLMSKCDRRTFEQANLTGTTSGYLTEFFNSFYLNSDSDQKGVYITCHDLEPDTTLTLTTWAVPVKCENFPGETVKCNTGDSSYLLNIPFYVMSAYEYSETQATNTTPSDQILQKVYALEAINRDANGQPKSYQTNSPSGDRNTQFTKMQDTCGYNTIQPSSTGSGALSPSTAKGCACAAKAKAAGFGNVELPEKFALEDLLLSLLEIALYLLLMFTILRKLVKLELKGKQ